jgi:hypothetical protein
MLDRLAVGPQLFAADYLKGMQAVMEKLPLAEVDTLIEDAHMMIVHLVTAYFREAYARAERSRPYSPGPTGLLRGICQ